MSGLSPLHYGYHLITRNRTPLIMTARAHHCNVPTRSAAKDWLPPMIARTRGYPYLRLLLGAINRSCGSNEEELTRCILLPTGSNGR